MRTYRPTKGPFLEAPFFRPEQIEQICDEELRKFDLLPSEPQPIRIERFIEKRFRVSPTYEELPPGALGFTQFGDKGVEAIVISRTLAEEESKTAERRINTTLAHEAGHGLLHAHLFIAGSQPERLFGDGFDPKVPKILCRDPSTGKYDGRWWEFQANQTIGALLLPKTLAEKGIEKVLTCAGSFGLPQLLAKDREKAVSILSTTFNVNPAVARIRVDQLFPHGESGQLTL